MITLITPGLDPWPVSQYPMAHNVPSLGIINILYLLGMYLLIIYMIYIYIYIYIYDIHIYIYIHVMIYNMYMLWPIVRIYLYSIYDIDTCVRLFKTLPKIQGFQGETPHGPLPAAARGPMVLDLSLSARANHWAWSREPGGIGPQILGVFEARSNHLNWIGLGIPIRK